MKTATATTAKKTDRRVATPDSIAAASKGAAIADISRQLIDRVYGVSQAEMAEVLEIQKRQAEDKIRLEMLLGKMLIAHKSGAAVQPGPLTLHAQNAKVNASVSWKGVVEETQGKEYAKALLAAAQQEAALKVGELFVRVVAADQVK